MTLLEEGQRRHTAASCGPGRGEDGPAHRARATGFDDPGQPDCPRPEARDVQRHHHSLVSRQQGQRHTEQGRAQEDLIEGRPSPPAPHPPQTRPTRTGVLGRSGAGQSGGGDALRDEETQHRPGDGPHDRCAYDRGRA
jgi:hypothetical protein